MLDFQLLGGIRIFAPFYAVNFVCFLRHNILAFFSFDDVNVSTAFNVLKRGGDSSKNAHSEEKTRQKFRYGGKKRKKFN